MLVDELRVGRGAHHQSLSCLKRLTGRNVKCQPSKVLILVFLGGLFEQTREQRQGGHADPRYELIRSPAVRAVSSDFAGRDCLTTSIYRPKKASNSHTKHF